jgi:hypothetical protein
MIIIMMMMIIIIIIIIIIVIIFLSYRCIRLVIKRSLQYNYSLIFV